MSGNKKSSPRPAIQRAGGVAHAPPVPVSTCSGEVGTGSPARTCGPLAEQACRRDDDPDDERSQAGQQQDFMENSAHLLPPGLEDGITSSTGTTIQGRAFGSTLVPGNVAGEDWLRLGRKGRVERPVQPRFR
jgi:hypothetical protein